MINSISKSLLNNNELKSIKIRSLVSHKKQLAYFNTLKSEGLVKHWLSFHQFKRLGLYDSLINHKSKYPQTAVKGKRGFVVFNVSSDLKTGLMDWKDKRSLKAHLKANDVKAKESYLLSVRAEQVRLLRKVSTQIKKGNFVTLALVNNGRFSNRELSSYIFDSVIKEFEGKGLFVIKCYQYYLTPSYKGFVESQLVKGHIHLIQKGKEVLFEPELQV